MHQGKISISNALNCEEKSFNELKKKFQKLITMNKAQLYGRYCWVWWWRGMFFKKMSFWTKCEVCIRVYTIHINFMVAYRKKTFFPLTSWMIYHNIRFNQFTQKNEQNIMLTLFVQEALNFILYFSFSTTSHAFIFSKRCLFENDWHLLCMQKEYRGF